MEKFSTEDAKALTDAFSLAVEKAVKEHWAAGRSVYEYVDGEVREVKPPKPA